MLPATKAALSLHPVPDCTRSGTGICSTQRVKLREQNLHFAAARFFRRAFERDDVIGGKLHNQVAAGHADLNCGVWLEQSCGQTHHSRRTGTGTAGLSFPGATFPDANDGAAGSCYLHELDIRAIWKLRMSFNQRANRVKWDGVQIINLYDRMGVAHHDCEQLQRLTLQ